MLVPNAALERSLGRISILIPLSQHSIVQTQLGEDSKRTLVHAVVQDTIDGTSCLRMLRHK